MADNWFNFGFALGFSEEDLQSIKYSNDNDVARCSAMMYHWLRTGDQREKTHERLLRAAKVATPPVVHDGMSPEPPPYSGLGTQYEDIGTSYQGSPSGHGDEEHNTAVHEPGQGPDEHPPEDDVTWRDNGRQLSREQNVATALTPDMGDLESSKVQTEIAAGMIPSDVDLKTEVVASKTWTHISQAESRPLGLLLHSDLLSSSLEQEPQEMVGYGHIDLKHEASDQGNLREAYSLSNDAIPAWVEKMADNWFNFGIALDISEKDLQSIRDSNDDDAARCSAVMYHWLRTGDQKEKTHERLFRAAKEATPPVVFDGICPEPPPRAIDISKHIDHTCFVLGDAHTLQITHQGGTFSLHPFGPHGGEQHVECCATLEAPPGVVGSGVTVSVHYAIILDGPFKLPEKWERTSVVLYIDCPEKGLLREPLSIKLRHWAVCQPDALAVMKADHDITGRQREGIMFGQFSASAVSFSNAVKFYLKEHFCLICTAMKQSIEFNSQCSPTHPINCFLMKVPDDETATKFQIFLMYGVPSWIKAVCKYCLHDVKGKMKPQVEPIVLSEDSLSVILKRKEGNGWKVEITKEKLSRRDLDFRKYSGFNHKEKEEVMNYSAYPPRVDCLIVHKQTPTEETHFKDTNKVIFRSGPNEASFISVVWEAKVQSNGDRTKRPSDHVHPEIPTIQNSPIPYTNGVESASNPSSIAKHLCQRILKGPHLDEVPSDPELLKVSDKVPCWYNLAVALGVPIDKANAYKSSDNGLGALCYWRNGRSSKGYPTTWKFLLDKIEEVEGSTVAEEVHKYIFPSLHTELCNSNGFDPSPSNGH